MNAMRCCPLSASDATRSLTTRSCDRSPFTHSRQYASVLEISLSSPRSRIIFVSASSDPPKVAEEYEAVSLDEMEKRHAELGRLRLVVTRAGDIDTMTLRAESDTHDPAFARTLAESLRAVTKLGGEVELLAPGSLPNDGKVIEDARTYQ